MLIHLMIESFLGHLNSILDIPEPLFLTEVHIDPLSVCEDLVFDLSDLSSVALVILQASVINLLFLEVTAS
jgi:hypothetical protein